MALASALALANEVMNDFGEVLEQTLMAFEWPALPSTKEERSKIWKGKSLGSTFFNGRQPRLHVTTLESELFTIRVQ